MKLELIVLILAREMKNVTGLTLTLRLALVALHRMRAVNPS
jgi:hypothetical protein